MKTVNQLSAAAPRSHVMLLAHQLHSGKVLCACQVPKVTADCATAMSPRGGRGLVIECLIGCPLLPTGLAVPPGL